MLKDLMQTGAQLVKIDAKGRIVDQRVPSAPDHAAASDFIGYGRNRQLLARQRLSDAYEAGVFGFWEIWRRLFNLGFRGPGALITEKVEDPYAMTWTQR